MSVIVKSAVMGPNIITDGLVLYLDAANSQSYPGSGNVWYDLSSYDYNWTVPSDIYSDGYLHYSGDTSSKSASSEWLGDSECTIDCWFYPVSSGGIYGSCCDTIFGRYDFRFFMINQSIYTMISFDNGGERYYQHPYFSLSYDNWHNVVGMRRNNNFIIWIDGVEMHNSSFGTGLDLYNVNSSWLISTVRHSSVKFSSAKIYNKGLTDTEILQNYNTLKNRFEL